MELKQTRAEWYTISNFSERFKISRPTIYKRIKERELQTLVIDGVTFVKPK